LLTLQTFRQKYREFLLTAGKIQKSLTKTWPPFGGFDHDEISYHKFFVAPFLFFFFDKKVAIILTLIEVTEK